MYYDREGKPIDQTEWGEKFRDMDYKRVERTDLPNGIWVSTVWLGLDHGIFQDGPPVIFETMVFGEGNGDEYQERYSTEAEARAGHEKAVDLYKKKSAQ